MWWVCHGYLPIPDFVPASRGEEKLLGRGGAGLLHHPVHQHRRLLAAGLHPPHDGGQERPPGLRGTVENKYQKKLHK